MSGEEREISSFFSRGMVPIIVFTILSLDQLTKFLVNKSLGLNHSLPVISGIFSITLVHNRGAAFGIFKNQFNLFIFISVTAVCLIYSILKDNKHNNSYAYSLSLILAGALGNLIDRISLGYVVDFLDFHIWPVFNLADSAITIGAVFLGWSILKAK